MVEICGEADGCQEAVNRVNELIELHKERQQSKERSEFTPGAGGGNFAKSGSRSFNNQPSMGSNNEEGGRPPREFSRSSSHRQDHDKGTSGSFNQGGSSSGGRGGGDLGQYGGNSYRNPYGMGYGGGQQQSSSLQAPQQAPAQRGGGHGSNMNYNSGSRDQYNQHSQGNGGAVNNQNASFGHGAAAQSGSGH